MTDRTQEGLDILLDAVEKVSGMTMTGVIPDLQLKHIEAERVIVEMQENTLGLKRQQAISKLMDRKPLLMAAWAAFNTRVDRARFALEAAATPARSPSTVSASGASGSVQKQTMRSETKAPGRTPSTASASSGADFMGVSRKLAKEDGISMTAAMSKTARENPELHQHYKDSQRATAGPGVKAAARR